jgi:DNA-binding IclR family transcriptional regulator
LPSGNELAERYRTSRPTVRRAIALLKAEGLVNTEQRRGAFRPAKAAYGGCCCRERTCVGTAALGVRGSTPK